MIGIHVSRLIKQCFHKNHIPKWLRSNVAWSRTRYSGDALNECQFEQNAYFNSLTITQYWLDNTIIIISFSDNATIIYWMKETNSCFLRIASKAPVRIQQNLYTAFKLIWQSNLQNFIFSWQVLCEKMKIKVSSV